MGIKQRMQRATSEAEIDQLTREAGAAAKDRMSAETLRKIYGARERRLAVLREAN
jgi:hypothetical protein